MSRRNDHGDPTGQALDRARRQHGRRSPAAAAAAERYGTEIQEQVTARVGQEAAQTQQNWDRNGKPLWMRIKTALGLAGRRG